MAQIFISYRRSDSLKELAFNNALSVRDDPDFHRDMDRLIEQIANHVSKSDPQAKSGAAPVINHEPLRRNPAIIAALIGAVAVIIGAIITLGPQLFRQETVTPTLMAQVPTSAVSGSTPTPTKTPTATATLSPEEAALQLALTPVVSNAAWTPFETTTDGVTMVLVPAGRFQMGSDNSWQGDEKPVNEQVFETPFWIDKYEVTNEQFAQLKGAAENASKGTGPKSPREQITWFEAQDFCALRGARLPTEREWEYAARGPDNLDYPWGPTWNAENVVWSENSNGQMAEVGSHPEGQSWVGAQDLSGNVWEWVSSWYMTYPYDVTDRREADTSNDTNVVYRVVRGGSWFLTFPDGFRAARRGHAPPDGRGNGFGFRCVRSS